jgi:hypothetical protein
MTMKLNVIQLLTCILHLLNQNNIKASKHHTIDASDGCNRTLLISYMLANVQQQQPHMDLLIQAGHFVTNHLHINLEEMYDYCMVSHHQRDVNMIIYEKFFESGEFSSNILDNCTQLHKLTISRATLSSTSCEVKALTNNSITTTISYAIKKLNLIKI